MATGLVVDVGAVAVAVEDHDEFGGPVDGCDGMGCHGGEFGGFAGVDGDLAFAERQAHLSLDDEEPVVAGMDAMLRGRAGRFQSHLDGDRAAGWAAQHPGRVVTGAVRRRADDHIVVAARVEEHVEVDLQGRCQRHEDVEADRPLAGLDAADGRGTEVGAGGELVE